MWKITQQFAKVQNMFGKLCQGPYSIAVEHKNQKTISVRLATVKDFKNLYRHYNLSYAISIIYTPQNIIRTTILFTTITLNSYINRLIYSKWVIFLYTACRSSMFMVLNCFYPCCLSCVHRWGWKWVNYVQIRPWFWHSLTKFWVSGFWWNFTQTRHGLCTEEWVSLTGLRVFIAGILRAF